MRALWSGGKVRPGQRVNPQPGDRTAIGWEAGLDEGPADQRLQGVETRLESDRLVRHGRSAGGRQEGAVGGDEGDVGLRVPAVDGQDRRLVRAARAARATRARVAGVPGTAGVAGSGAHPDMITSRPR